MNTTITGRAAIYIAHITGSTLASYSDPTEGNKDDLEVEDARRIIREDPSLVYTTTTLAALRERIEKLATEAGAAGDAETVEECQAALGGSEEALIMCVQYLSEAWAQTHG